MFESFLSELTPFYEVAVLSHIRPDADCIGAQSGVCSLLEAHDIKYTAFNEDPVPANLQWMKHAKKIKLLEPGSLEAFEAVIFVDGNQYHRFTRKGDIVYEGTPFMSFMIDHHPHPDTNFDVVCSDPTASSTCELIFRWFEQVGLDKLDPSTAQSLFAGMMRDTGLFSFENTASETLKTAGELLRIGNFTPNVVVDKMADRSLGTVKAMGEVMQSIELTPGGKVATIMMTKEQMEYCAQFGEVDTDGFVNQALAINGVEVALFLKEAQEEEVRMSLRAKRDVDVNVWARDMNGGGHQKAAGAMVQGSLERAREEALDVGRRHNPDLFRF